MAKYPTCPTCKHVRYERILFIRDKDNPKCARVLSHDYVSGVDETTYCSIARAGGVCGSQGRLHEPQDEKCLLETEPVRLESKPGVGDCPYCLKPVGILGNWLAKLFGTRFHGCTFSNVKPPLSGKQ